MLLPWVGLTGAVLGWLLTSQVALSVASLRCGDFAPVLTVAIGLAGCAISMPSALVAYSQTGYPSFAMRVIARIGLVAAASVTVFIVFQTVRDIIQPSCIKPTAPLVARLTASLGQVEIIRPEFGDTLHLGPVEHNDAAVPELYDALLT